MLAGDGRGSKQEAANPGSEMNLAQHYASGMTEVPEHIWQDALKKRDWVRVCRVPR